MSYGTIRQKESWTLMASYAAEKVNFSASIHWQGKSVVLAAFQQLKNFCSLPCKFSLATNIFYQSEGTSDRKQRVKKIKGYLIHSKMN